MPPAATSLRSALNAALTSRLGEPERRVVTCPVSASHTRTSVSFGSVLSVFVMQGLPPAVTIACPSRLKTPTLIEAR
jgi:hypothetical protein